MPAVPTTRAARSRSRRQLLPRLRCFVGAVPGRIGFWIERRRQRRVLADLTDDQLRDIGLSRSQAVREAGKPFWKP